MSFQDLPVVTITAETLNVTVPEGAATSAKQDSELTLLTSIDGKSPALGNAVMANSVPVTMASDQEHFGVHLADHSTGITARITSRGELKTASRKVLVGGNFNDTAPLVSEWTTTLTNNGTAVFGAGLLTLSNSTTANGSAILNSTKTSRSVIGFDSVYEGSIKLGDTGGSGNIRRWGAFDVNNGYFFQLSDTTFSIISRLATSDITVTSFNGASPTVDTNFHLYEIYFQYGGASFFQDGILIHSISFNGSVAIVGNCDLPTRVENVNSGGATANRNIVSRGTCVAVLGNSAPKPRHTYISTATTTYISRGASTLHKIVNVRKAGGGALATVYDSLAGSGTVLAIIELDNVVTTFDFGEVDVVNGITIVTTGSGMGLTVIAS